MAELAFMKQDVSQNRFRLISEKRIVVMLRMLELV